MSLPLSSLPLKRFIQNTSLRGGFFQAHLYPAVMSVNWVPPPPLARAVSSREEVLGLHLLQATEGGAVLASPHHHPTAPSAHLMPAFSSSVFPGIWPLTTILLFLCLCLSS